MHACCETYLRGAMPKFANAANEIRQMHPGWGKS